MNKILAALLCLFSSTTPALTILHQETVDGDLDIASFPELGQLTSDQYVIDGSIYWTGCSPNLFPCIGDLDAFYFSIPDGYTVDVSITSTINLVMSPETAADITYLELEWWADSDTSHHILSWGSEAIGNPVTHEIQNFTSQGFFFQTSTGSLIYEGPEFYDPDRISMDYTISLDVHPVPLPGTLALLASGLTLIAGFRRKNTGV